VWGRTVVSIVRRLSLTFRSVSIATTPDLKETLLSMDSERLTETNSYRHDEVSYPPTSENYVIAILLVPVVGTNTHHLISSNPCHLLDPLLPTLVCSSCYPKISYVN